MSDSREVMKEINPEERGKTFKELDLSSDVLPIERTLDRPLTRRGFLSILISVYDPLDLAAPFLSNRKIYFTAAMHRKERLG